MLKEYNEFDGCTISVLYIAHPSARCLFNSIGSNSRVWFPFLNSSVNSELTLTINCKGLFNVHFNLEKLSLI